jgi:DNA-directed RNA polymerase subunit H (RpoH/RPB5)
MSLNPQLLPIRKDAEEIRKTVLLNITKMLSERGLLDKSKIATFVDKFKTATDDNTYTIDLDTPIKSDINDSEYNKKFNGKRVVVRMIPQKIIGVNKSPVIKEFLENFRTNHKILIFDSISEKARHSILSTPNTEVFFESFFMINLVDHLDSPKYTVLSDAEVTELLATYNVKKNQLMKMLTTDKVSYYYNLKRGQIVRIIRSSEQTVTSVAYRIVAKGSS